MKRIYKIKYVDLDDYKVCREMRTNYKELYFLTMELESKGEYDWIVCNVHNDKNKVFIYSEDSYKKQAKLEFETEEEQNLFDDQYVAYCDKRWSEMPKVIMSIQDWEELQVKWEKIKNEKPEYVIFTLDDSGALDKVDVYGKNELTEEDKVYIKQEHENFLKYERAHQKYIDNHPDYSYVWRGPQDDEYEADIMKYYEE